MGLGGDNMEEIRKDLSEVTKLLQIRLKDPYFAGLIREWQKIQTDMDLNRQSYDVPELVADELQGRLDETVTLRQVVEKFIEYILESDMQGITVPTDILALLDSIGYLIITTKED